MANSEKEFLKQRKAEVAAPKPKRQVAEPLTLLKAFEQLLDLAEGSKLSKGLYTRGKKMIDHITHTLGITPIQAVLMAIILNGDRDETVAVSQISRTLGCKNLRLYNYLHELDDLENKGYVECRRRYEDHGYRVPSAVLTALKENRKWERESLAGITVERLFDVLDNLYEKRDDGDISIERLTADLKDIFSKNQQLNFCNQIVSSKLDDNDMLLLVFFCHKIVNHNDDAIILQQFSDVFDNEWQCRKARREFRAGSHTLIRRELVEPNNEDGMLDGRSFHLTNTTKQNLLAEMKITECARPLARELTPSSEILAKKMFYNPAEEHNVKQLMGLLEEKTFAEIIKRMTEKGMRTGFNCLFYGMPGTGKTETVLQLARLTGRDIMQVNIPEIKSKWVGESEKNIKNVFDRYRKHVKECDKMPILLFNEADAVLGKRFETVERSVDKMENAIQNIILQEMETLHGIMIATTNLTGNLDKAFERRFLYKIRFNKPTLEARKSIWFSMLPDLNEQQAHELAEDYDFSGGQIENIARKKTVDDIINLTEGIDMEAIHAYCRSERIDARTTSNVGFRI